MKIFKFMLGVGLFCNVIAIAILLYEAKQDVFIWLNLIGCVLFGGYVSTLFGGKIPQTKKDELEQAHMAGQADTGIDPSYSNAQCYTSRITSKTKKD